MQLSPSTQQVKPKTAKKIAVKSETRAFIGNTRLGRRSDERRSRSDMAWFQGKRSSTEE
jgi:hypothetical protein